GLVLPRRQDLRPDERGPEEEQEPGDGAREERSARGREPVAHRQARAGHELDEAVGVALAPVPRPAVAVAGRAVDARGRHGGRIGERAPPEGQAGAAAATGSGAGAVGAPCAGASRTATPAASPSVRASARVTTTDTTSSPALTSARTSKPTRVVRVTTPVTGPPGRGGASSGAGTPGRTSTCTSCG